MLIPLSECGQLSSHQALCAARNVCSTHSDSFHPTYFNYHCAKLCVPVHPFDKGECVGYAQNCATETFVDVVQRGNLSDVGISLMFGITSWTYLVLFVQYIAILIIISILNFIKMRWSDVCSSCVCLH